MKQTPPIHEQIRSARECAGLTQDALALLTGFKQHSISRMESGKQDAKVSTLQRIADATGGRFIIVSSLAKNA